MNARLARCRALLDDLSLDGVVVGAAADVRYLCGFRGADATLIIGREVALICTDARYWEQVREEAAVSAIRSAPRASTSSNPAASSRTCSQ